MDEYTYLKLFFETKKISIPKEEETIFEEFIQQEKNQNIAKTILEQQQKLIMNWDFKRKIMDINQLVIIIPNATEGKEYSEKIDFEKYGFDIKEIYFEGLEELGLAFDEETQTIKGKPTKNGELSFTLFFKLKEDKQSDEFSKKSITIIINPNPKSLWKNIDSNKDDLFWKEDDVAISQKLGEKNIVVASKRGRSHKNVGGFREDDFAFKYFEKTEWSLVVVSDGAGSSSLSRKGSKLACESVIEFCNNYFEDVENQKYSNLENAISDYQQIEKEETEEDQETKVQSLAKAKTTINKFILDAASFVHKKIAEHAEKTVETKPEFFDKMTSKSPLEHYHATLIFALFKKYEFGYVLLTFGVGDCPIAILNKNQDQITLLNKLDVGEFGGGTRFITQPSIFTSQEQKIESRCNLILIEDFSYLFLMTDGIYDAKFEVEANLEKTECWTEFLEDLQGKNEEKTTVEFDPNNSEIAEQLSTWTDFWSIGNHDDRTLAIIY